jgi:hypothetical protein
VQLLGLPVAQTVGNHDNSANYLGHYNPPNLDNDKGSTYAGGDYWYEYKNVLFIRVVMRRIPPPLGMGRKPHAPFRQYCFALL